MPIQISNKVILITEVPRITTAIKIALNQVGLEIVSDYPALSSLSLMRSGIAKSGKTAFIRTELLRFMKEKGFPRAIIMDSMIDPGTMPDVNADMLKIFKTFLIAYIILRKGDKFAGIKGNFILLTKGDSFGKETGIARNPHNAMNILSTQNPEINILLDDMKDNPDKFRSLFSIELIDTDKSTDIIRESIVKFITATEQRNTPAAAVQLETNNPIHETATGSQFDKIPARILYRIDGGTVYDDGEIITELTDEHRSLNEKEFYVIGTWANGTEHAVAKKIATIILKGIEGKLRFNYNEEIIFNLDDRCIMDSNTTLAMAQLFTKNLAIYKKIKIKGSVNNSYLIQKSRGYPMIRNIFTVKE